MYKPEEDGITHINAYSKSDTELGHLLSNFTYAPFTCRDGSFKCIEGYWYWLGTDHPNKNQLREVYGFMAKKIGKDLRNLSFPKDPKFQEKILKACWQKILQNANFKSLLRESTLPIVHYYRYGSKIIVPEESKWIWEWYEKARKYLKEHPEV